MRSLANTRHASAWALGCLVTMFGMFNMGGRGGTFEHNYRCYPVSFIDKVDAENGDKVFLPSSALDRLGKDATTSELAAQGHGSSLACHSHCKRTRSFVSHLMMHKGHLAPATWLR